MPLADQIFEGNKIGEFFVSKSIQHSFAFEVYLNFDINPNFKDWVNQYIDTYHVVDVTIPTYKFQRESVSFGTMQYSYPVLSKEQPLDVAITFEEDQNGVISHFIRMLEQSVVFEGLHQTPKNMRLGDIIVSIKSIYAQGPIPVPGSFPRDGDVISTLRFRNVFFLGSEPVTLSYNSNEAIQYKITFGTDNIEYDGNDNLDTVLIRNPANGLVGQ